MPNNNYGGNSASKKQKVNEWTGEGIVQSRGGNDNGEIKFFPFRSGGGAIHFTVMCSEITGADQNGQPRTETSYIPVNVMTNKLITEQQLRTIRPGMKVKIVGKLRPESYTSKVDGKKKTSLAVNAYVLEILQMPQDAYPQGGYPQGAPGGYAQPYPQGGYLPQGGYPAPQYPAYAQQPAYGQGVQPPYNPPQGAPQYPAYAQQPAYGPGPQAPHNPQQGQQEAVPPYYAPPQQGTQSYQGPAAPGSVEDIPM